MPNDAKLGMLAGVCGVVVAAILFSQPQSSAPPPAQNAPQVIAPAPVPQTDSTATNTLPTVAPAPSPVEPDATPVVRTRKDVDAKPTSRQPQVDDDP